MFSDTTDRGQKISVWDPPPKTSNYVYALPKNPVIISVGLF